MTQDYKTTLFRLFGSADKQEYENEVKEFNMLNNSISNYLKTNGVKVSPGTYIFQDTTIFKDDFSEPEHGMRTIRGIELKIEGSEEKVQEASNLLKQKFRLDDFESAGLTWDSVFECLLEER